MKNIKYIISLKKIVVFLLVLLTNSFLLSISMLQAQTNTENNYEKMDDIEQLSPKEAIHLLKKDSVVMIDVREKQEIEAVAYDVDSILHIPVSNFEEIFEIQSKTFLKSTNIIVACRSGRRSQKIAKILKEKGYVSVYNLKGGIIEWEKQHLKVKKSSLETKDKK